jgi:guanine nucleotide-binding protein subunit alpha
VPCSGSGLCFGRSFFPQLDRFFEPSYKPLDQDILHCRAQTAGITETVFKLKTHELHLLDVGGTPPISSPPQFVLTVLLGQKSERRKWIHCFENVTSILFLASLNGYDMSLSEDRDAVCAFTKFIQAPFLI